MATRTQKAAMKKKAEAEKSSAAAGAGPRAKGAAKPKGAKDAAKGAKPSVKAKAAKAAKPGKSRTAPAAEPAPLPEPKRTSFSERFWHRLGLRAQKKEAEAHRHEAEVEAAEARAEAERLEQEREQRKAKTAAERRKEAAAAREMKRIAEEEAVRLREGEARKAKEAKMSRAERARAARDAKAAEEEAARREAAREEQERLQREQHDREVEAAAAEAEAMLAAAKAKRAQKAPVEEMEVEPDEFDADEEPEPAPGREPVQAARPMVTMRPSPAARAAEQEADEEEGEAVEVEDPTPTRSAAKAAPPRPEPATELDRQADKVAEELMARRSKPITIDVEDEAVPTLPVGRKTRPAEEKQVLQLDPAPPAQIPEMHAPRGLSIPEHFILLAIDEAWDERIEKVRPGALGGGLTGALLLDLVLHGKAKVQRDRFQLTDVPVDDASAAVVAKLRQIGDRPSMQAMGELAKWLPQLLPAYKDRMASRGLVAHKSWRHMGMFYRSQTALLDPDAQERLRNKLARAIAGGGRPDAPTILSLGLLEASGLFGVVVPEGAQAYNRKRLNGLLGGKDVMGYKVDDELKGTQEMAVRTILDNVRLMTTRG